MAELGSAEYPKSVNIRGYKPNTSVHIGQLKRAIKTLSKAKKPLFLAGGGINISHANKVFQEVVEKTGVPVVTTIMGRGAIPTNHPLFIGNLGMHGAYAANMAVSNCDVLFSIGTRFNDRITGKLHEFAPNAQIIPVSYTHLDVYKRQMYDNWLKSNQFQENCILNYIRLQFFIQHSTSAILYYNNFTVKTLYVRTVSYTHLDVYKRQNGFCL